MNPFSDTHTVAFELSNTCPLAWFHARCPLHLQMESPFRMKEVKHLPGALVYGALDSLGRYDYGGEINFHQYNEPLIDPRLFQFVRYARATCPKAEIVLLTSGVYLSSQLAVELREAGLGGLWLTLYGNEIDKAATLEWFRREIIPLFPTDKSNVYTWGELDDRMENYSRDYVDRHLGCQAPLCTLVITCDGDLALCCQDWQRTMTFGNLREASLEELVTRQEPRALYEGLRKGIRESDLCRRCKSSITPFGKA